MTIVYPVPEILPDPRARFIQILNTCNALAKANIKVKLLTGIKRGYSAEDIMFFYGLQPNPNLEIIKLPILRGQDSKYFRFSWHGVYHFSLLLYLLRKRISGNTSCILFLRHLKLANFLLRFKKWLNLYIVFEVHEIFHLNTQRKKKGKILKQLELNVYKNVDILICISELLKEYLIRMGVKNKPIHIIPDSVKKEWFDIKAESLGKYICYTGSLYSWKGVDTLISSMKYLPNEELVIVGGGSRLEELKKLAEKENVASRVKFVGNVPHSLIPEYLAEAKIGVLPNIAEGPSLMSSPLKLFEYMACGIPIVASDIKVFREILSDSENAILFKPGDPKGLAQGIKKLIDNPEVALNLAETARKNAKDYTYEKRAEKILKILQGV